MSARLSLRALLALIVVGASLFSFAHAAHASSDEDYFVNQINQIRASRGLGTLAVDGQLTAVARSWSQNMAGDATLAHNPNLAGQVSGWRTLGENVGTGPDDASIEVAFENSPHHFANMVDPSYNYIGVGVVQDPSGIYWVTEDFRQSTNAPQAAPAPSHPAPAPPKPAPKPAVAPRPAAAPVHAATAHPTPAAASAAKPAPSPVATTVATPPPSVPLAVLGSRSARPAPAPAFSGANPFSATNLAGLMAVVFLGSSMALFARVRITRATSPVSG
jgi:hypothetical protein